jgi:virginiamycin B lyase
MRTFILGLALVFTTFAAAPTHRGEGPKDGVKTPGIQIPFSSLKPEAAFPTSRRPDWVFYSTQVFVPADDHIDKVDLKSNKFGDPIAGIRQPCGGMTSAFGSVWVASCGDGSLVRIDTKTAKVVATISSGAADIRGSLASSADSVWMLTDLKTTLSRIDPDQNAVVGEFRVPAGCESLTSGEKALWLACPNDNEVLRINPETNLVDKEISVSARPESLAVGANSVWVFCAKDGKIDRIDPKTNQVTKTIELNVPGAKGAIAYGDGFVWASVAGFPLTRIDPEAGAVVQQFYGAGGGIIATSPGAIWLTNSDGVLLRIDTKRVLATLAE